MASLQTTRPEIGCEIHFPRPGDDRLEDDGPDAHRSDTPSTVSDDAMQEDLSLSIDPQTAQPQTSGTVDPSSIPSAHPSDSSHNEGTKTRSSRYRGVCWNKKNKRWQAAINNGGRYIYLGSFTSDIDAAKAFDLAALQIRGKNTKLNFSVDSYTEEEWKSGPPPHLAEKYTSGTARPKTQPFRDFAARPMKKLHPSQFATIHVSVKRGRYEEPGFGTKAFDRAEQSFLNNDFITPPVTGQPRIKQEFPTTAQISARLDPSFKKTENLGSPFEKSPFYFLQSGGISTSPIQPSRSVKTPSITTPPFGGSRGKDVFDQTRGFSRSSDVTYAGLATDRMDDSAERLMEFTPVAPKRQQQQQQQTCPLPQTLHSSSNMTDRLPVPVLQSAQDDASLHVSSVISETVSGSDIEEAKTHKQLKMECTRMGWNYNA